MSTTTSTTVQTNRGLGATPPPPASPPSPPTPPSQTSGVLTRLDPGVGVVGSGVELRAQEDLAVRFVRTGENLGFNIVANLILGVFLAWASVSSLERKRRAGA